MGVESRFKGSPHLSFLILPEKKKWIPEMRRREEEIWTIQARKERRRKAGREGRDERKRRRKKKKPNPKNQKKNTPKTDEGKEER